jgi:hypothetical protein
MAVPPGTARVIQAVTASADVGHGSEVDRDFRHEVGDRAGRRAHVDVRDDALAARPTCRTCGTPLDGEDPDEDPTGDAGEPICGNCDREREFFDLDVMDGHLDGRLDLFDDRDDE